MDNPVLRSRVTVLRQPARLISDFHIEVEIQASTLALKVAEAGEMRMEVPASVRARHMTRLALKSLEDRILEEIERHLAAYDRLHPCHRHRFWAAPDF